MRNYNNDNEHQNYFFIKKFSLYSDTLLFENFESIIFFIGCLFYVLS